MDKLVQEIEGTNQMICRFEDCDVTEENCIGVNSDSCPCLQEILQKLKEYQQLEEQGLLHKAPLPNGTPIYYWQQNEDDEWFVFKDSYLHGVTEFFQGKFGKDFFATEEECRNHSVS